jgi:hypothetical protein
MVRLDDVTLMAAMPLDADQAQGLSARATNCRRLFQLRGGSTMTSQEVTVSSKSKFAKNAQATEPFDDNLEASLDEVVPVRREASKRRRGVPADIIRPSKFILGPF